MPPAKTPEQLMKIYEVPLYLLRRGLRSCEYLDKSRFVGCDDVEKLIIFKGKRKPYGIEKPRTVFISDEMYEKVKKYYTEHPHKLINPRTFYNACRKLGIGKKLAHRKTLAVTHSGRYGWVVPGMAVDDLLAAADDRGHSPTVAIKYYEREMLMQAKKRLAERN